MAILKTPLCAAYIAKLVKAHGQEQLAQLCDISRATISHHMTGERVVRDNHAALYMAGLRGTSRAEFIAAWLRDWMPLDTHADIIDEHSSTLQESVTRWKPALSPDLASMLEWWSRTLAADPELADIFVQVTRKMGFDGASESHQLASDSPGYGRRPARQVDADLESASQDLGVETFIRPRKK